MTLHRRHVMAAPFTKLAKDLEQTFFRIEQANSWQAAIVNGAIAGAAVSLVAWMLTSLEEGDLLLFACLGSGRLHGKSCVEQYFCEVIVVPSGVESFVLDSDFGGGLSLEETQSCATERAEVGVSVPLAEATLVFTKRHVQLPV